MNRKISSRTSLTLRAEKPRRRPSPAQRDAGGVPAVPREIAVTKTGREGCTADGGFGPCHMVFGDAAAAEVDVAEPPSSQQQQQQHSSRRGRRRRGWDGPARSSRETESDHAARSAAPRSWRREQTEVAAEIPVRHREVTSSQSRRQSGGGGAPPPPPVNTSRTANQWSPGRRPVDLDGGGTAAPRVEVPPPPPCAAAPPAETQPAPPPAPAAPAATVGA